MKIANVNQTPRSKVFKYYNSAAGQLVSSGGSSTYVPPNIPDREDQILVQDTFSDLPLPPESYVVMAIVLDTKQTYIWDDANSVWVNATINVGVSKIIQGTNISISPTTGTGDVTVNSEGTITLATQGTGNSVKNLTYSNGTLTQNLDYRLEQINTTPDQTASVSFFTAKNLPVDYSNGILSLPYKSLEQGDGINFEFNGSQVVIKATGGGSGVSSIIAGNNVTISPTTGTGDVTVNQTISTSVGKDNTNNLDLLTDATAMSNNLLAFKYKTLTAGTNITLYDNAGQIVINATGGGGTGGNVTDVSTGVTASNIFRYSFLPSVGTITPVPANDKLTFQIDQAILPFTPTQAFISINFRTYITNPWPAVLVFNSIGNDYAHAIEFFLFNPTANTCYIDGATVISLLFMG